MDEFISLLLPFGAGIALGVIFFGGLWLTILKSISSKNPAIWFFVSMILRTGIVVAGFYFVSGGQFYRLIAGLLGFVLVKIGAAAILKAPDGQTSLTKENFRD